MGRLVVIGAHRRALPGDELSGAEIEDDVERRDQGDPPPEPRDRFGLGVDASPQGGRDGCRDQGLDKTDRRGLRQHDHRQMDIAVEVEGLDQREQRARHIEQSKQGRGAADEAPAQPGGVK